jgi:RNA polymerase sigma factor for flagellar operon FliA
LNRVERNELVRQHLPLVGYLVSDLCSKAPYLSRDDVASAGAIALRASADAFGPDLGVPFGAFARRRILGAFADGIRAGGRTTPSADCRIEDATSVQGTLAFALDRTPTLDEMASALGVRQSAAEALLAGAAGTSAQAPLDEAVAGTLTAEMLSLGHPVLADERSRDVEGAVMSLPERMRYIVEALYFADRTVQDLATEPGSTHAAVSQQRSEAIRLIRDALTALDADGPGQAFEPQPEITPRFGNDYLSQLAEATAGGITRAIFPRGPLLDEAV